MDISVLLTVVPPVLTAVSAYLIASRKYAISERINKAKLETETQNQALIIVRGVMHDMCEDLRKDIESLKRNNMLLQEEVDENKKKINDLESQLRTSHDLIDVMKSEILTLKKTIALYEEQIMRLQGAGDEH
jgi:peptidoglycan hydrolase CwlO-like protein